MRGRGAASSPAGGCPPWGQRPGAGRAAAGRAPQKGPASPSAPRPGLPRSRGRQTHPVRSQPPGCRGGSKPGGLHGGGGAERGHGRRLQCGSQASGTAGVAGRGRWARRRGCSRAWDRQGDPLALRAGPWGRQSQAGRPNSASGGGAGPRAFPARGWGRLPGSPTRHRANSRTAGVPGAHTPQRRPLLGCGCAPRSRPSRNTRGAHCSPGCDACAPRLGPPVPGRSEPGMGLGPGAPRSAPSAGSCGGSALRAHGAGRDRRPLPDPPGARPALSPAPPRLRWRGNGSRAPGGQPARERLAAAHSPPPR